ncbi:MAG: 5-deoxy-glucuronate isomerase [Vicinamibacteria bacterium]
MTKLHFPRETLRTPGHDVVVTPENAGWAFSGLRVITLQAGESRTIETEIEEMLVVPIRGSAQVVCEGQMFDLEGRLSVFSRVTDFAYLPRDSQFTITSLGGGEFALPSALARRRLKPAYGPADKVPVEIRGAGGATRQLTNFCAPGVFETDRLSAVEVLTPPGNWSSYPPHKHDAEGPNEAILEEIYYFKMEGEATFGLHKTYASDNAFDITSTVRDGDVFLVPRGYHGPSIAPPEYALWYLNVLAGPAAERSMNFCDDPKHHWIRDSWQDQPRDPRVPMTSAIENTKAKAVKP